MLGNSEWSLKSICCSSVFIGILSIASHQKPDSKVSSKNQSIKQTNKTTLFWVESGVRISEKSGGRGGFKCSSIWSFKRRYGDQFSLSLLPFSPILDLAFLCFGSVLTQVSDQVAKWLLVTLDLHWIEIVSVIALHLWCYLQLVLLGYWGQFLVWSAPLGRGLA